MIKVIGMDSANNEHVLDVLPGVAGVVLEDNLLIATATRAILARYEDSYWISAVDEGSYDIDPVVFKHIFIQPA